MKIISKYRDYYDHLVGYYGFDETIVYDRRNKGESPSHPLKYGYAESSKYLFAICGELVPVVRIGKKFYFNQKDLPTQDYWVFRHLKIRGQKTDKNIQFRQPILMEYWGNWFIPILSDYNFPAHIDADTMYRKIYDFLSWLKDNPEAPQITDNDCKIRAHGFDVRRSFRPNMKS